MEAPNLKMKVTVLAGWDLMKVIDAGIKATELAGFDPGDDLNVIRQHALKLLHEQGVIKVDVLEEATKT